MAQGRTVNSIIGTHPVALRRQRGKLAREPPGRGVQLYYRRQAVGAGRAEPVHDLLDQHGNSDEAQAPGQESLDRHFVRG